MSGRKALSVIAFTSECHPLPAQRGRLRHEWSATVFWREDDSEPLLTTERFPEAKLRQHLRHLDSMLARLRWDYRKIPSSDFLRLARSEMRDTTDERGAYQRQLRGEL